MTETIGPSKPKIFTVWLFTRKLCQPLVQPNIYIQWLAGTAKATEFQEQARSVQSAPWERRLQLGLDKELDPEPEGTRTLLDMATNDSGCAGPQAPNARSTPIIGTSKNAPCFQALCLLRSLVWSGTRMRKVWLGLQRGQNSFNSSPWSLRNALFSLSINQQRGGTTYCRSIVLGRLSLCVK